MTRTRSVSEILSIGATVVLVICSLTMTAFVVRRGASPAHPPAWPHLEPEPDWAAYAAVGNRIGPASAPVTLIEFADYQCPACRALEMGLRDARRRHPDELAVVFRHFPLPMHRFALDAALASECAASQGRFDAMHSVLFDSQPRLGVAAWAELARVAGVPSISAFERCRSGSSARALIARDSIAAAHLGVHGTPTVLIDGVRFNGAGSKPQLDSLLDKLVEGALRHQRKS